MILDINIFPGISPFQYYSSLSFHYKTILQWKIHMEIQSPTHVKRYPWIMAFLRVVCVRPICLAQGEEQPALRHLVIKQGTF
jgi:hypothetical protein